MRAAGPPPSASAPSTSGAAPRYPRPEDVRVLRVSQVDAGRLDGELSSLLREQFLRIFARVHPGFAAQRTPELTLALDALVFYFTVWSHRPTPGMELMNLRYRDERRRPRGGRSDAMSARSGMEGAPLGVAQRVAYFVAFVGGRFAWSKLARHAQVRRWAEAPAGSPARVAARGIEYAENAYAAASLANLLAFLRSGVYRSPWERAIGARLVYEEPNAQRIVSYEYLNRQLVWTELSELALFVLPLVSAPRLRRAFGELFGGGGFGFGASGAAAGGASEARTSPSDDRAARTRALAPEEVRCAACGAKPATTPYAAQPCGHAYCYYCLRARCRLDPGYACAKCGERVAGMRRMGFFRGG